MELGKINTIARRPGFAIRLQCANQRKDNSHKGMCNQYPSNPNASSRPSGQQVHGFRILFCPNHLHATRAPACNIHYQLFTFHVYGKADSVMYDTYNNTGLYPMGEVKDCFFNFPASCHPRRGEAHFATATKQCLRIPLCAVKLSIWDASS